MSLEAPPPSRRISSAPISTADASRMLDTYLTNSEAHPHLHPDAQITSTGVSFSSHGGPLGSVAMHNLRRIAAGLRGEFLEPEKTPEPEEDEDQDDFGASLKFTKKGGKKRSEGWQDKAEFEREEGVYGVGDIGDRTNVVQDGGEEPEVQITGGPQVGGSKKRKTDAVTVEGEGEEGMSKEARKAAKKQRNKQEKRDKEQQRAKKD
jgi:hypothetical protein